MTERIVSLHKSQTQVRIAPHERRAAITSAFNVTLSPHEWQWSIEEQARMAQYVLWAHQRLCAVEQCVTEDELLHGDKPE